MAPPVFLSNCKAYSNYLRDVPDGELSLPVYEKDDQGGVIIHPGEVFCRVEDCEWGRKPISQTNNLRHHVHITHDLPVAKVRTGKLAVATKDAAKLFFKTLYAQSSSDVPPDTVSTKTSGPKFAVGVLAEVDDFEFRLRQELCATTEDRVDASVTVLDEDDKDNDSSYDEQAVAIDSPFPGDPRLEIYPHLPKTKKGEFSPFLMRQQIKRDGMAIPCNSCKDSKICCIDPAVCDHFVLY